MSLKNILKALAVGAVVYGAYKYGEKMGRENNQTSEEDVESVDPVNEEKNYIMDLIDKINSKPMISKKDRDNLGLLEVKLKQLINKK